MPTRILSAMWFSVPWNAHVLLLASAGVRSGRGVWEETLGCRDGSRHGLREEPSNHARGCLPRNGDDVGRSVW